MNRAPAGGSAGPSRLTVMQRRLRIVAAVVAGVLLLAFAGLAIYIHSIDFNRYIPAIQDAVLQQTGRTLLIDGRMHVSLSLHPSLNVEGAHLTNPPGFSRPNAVDVERMSIEISLLPLLSGELRIDHITLQHPDIRLERLADGRNNWGMAGAGGGAGMSAPDEAAAGSPVLLPRVHRLQIRDAQFSYRDATDGSALDLAIPKLELWEDDNAADPPLQLRADGRFNGLALRLRGALQSMHALADNEPVTLDMQATLAGVEMKLNGSVARPLDGKGLDIAVGLDAPGFGGLGQLLGLPPALDVPLHAQGSLKDDAQGYALQGLQARLGNSDLSGVVHLATQTSKPLIDAALQTRLLDVAELLPSGGHGQQGDAVSGKATSGTSKRVLPSTPLDVGWMKAFDARLGWRAGTVVLPGAQLADVDARVVLKDGVLDVSPLNMRLGGGTLGMQVVLNGSEAPPTMRMKLTGRSIAPAQLLPVVQGGEDEGPMLQGDHVDADVSLTGRGVSVADIMAHSNGRIKLRVGPGKVKSAALQLIGGDVLMTLADKLNPFSKGDPYMQLQCGVVHFRVEKGIMHTENGIAFETARMNILSSGSVNLRDESIDLSIGTEPREGIGINLSNLANVVRLGGTLAEPGIRVDVKKSGAAAARAAGAVMTGGLSLLGEGLYDRATADDAPCKTALNMK